MRPIKEEPIKEVIKIVKTKRTLMKGKIETLKSDRKSPKKTEELYQDKLKLMWGKEGQKL